MIHLTRRLLCAGALFVCASGSRAVADAMWAPSRPLESRLLKKAELKFPDGKAISVDVVDTPELRETGLMFRRKLLKDYGMLFVFPNEGGMQFWMKNTLTSLDIIFIDKSKKITVLHARVKESTVDTPESKVARVGGLAQYVLELPAGAAARHGLKAGQTLDFTVAIPER